ncbi:MAG: amino acid permease [Acidobacteriaceae bacterium]
MPSLATSQRTSAKMRLVPLIGATYFMVSGGPYGLEDIIGSAGYGRALLLLLFIPLVWSLPTALMVGELASALPEEGGYYRWVRRALGPFWGFQEAWLSLAASIFDMAIYPVTFVLYLSRIAPSWTAGPRGTLWALAVVLLCVVWNLRGARSVGEGSVGIFTILLAPFAVLVGLGFYRAAFAPAMCLGCPTHHDLFAPGGLVHILPNLRHSFTLLKAPVAAPSLAAAVSVTLWNYMGWDNASTVAQEVEDPQRNYPRAMLLSAALVAASYILPLLAVAFAGIDPARFSTGAWADAARSLGGPILAFAVVLGGTLNGAGMFNALMLSYARVPYALAADGLLPSFLTRTTRASVPWASVIVCAAAWALALRLSFERLISIDLVLYGAALLLEFVALVVLRIREPDLPRPFRIPGGLVPAILAGTCPALLIGFALYAARNEHVGPFNALLFAALVALAGPFAWLLARLSSRSTPPSAPSAK